MFRVQMYKASAKPPVRRSRASAARRERAQTCSLMQRWMLLMMQHRSVHAQWQLQRGHSFSSWAVVAAKIRL